MVDHQYKTCPLCAENRAAGMWADALDCIGCGGKGAVRTRESYVCNRCGGCMCPTTPTPNSEIPHGLVEAKVSGGYDSPALSDCTTYKFSICEPCLRILFNSFAVPPQIGEYMLGSGSEHDVEQTYAEEAEFLREAEAKQLAREAERARLYAAGLCTDHNRDENGNTTTFCGKPGVLEAVGDRFSWHLCEPHRNDAYMWSHSIVAGMTPEERKAIGRRYLDAFMRGEQPDLANEHERRIAISVLFPLVARPETWGRACEELARLTMASPEYNNRWASGRIATNFPPGSTATSEVNAWLHWGREQEYREATACAFLGYSAAKMLGADDGSGD